MPTPSREEFVKEVKNFKTIHGGKLKDLLKDSNLVIEFLNNEIIRNYLARPFEGIEKNSQSEPSFTDTNELLKKRLKDKKEFKDILKSQHEFNDHYELKFYKSVSVPYRDTNAIFSAQGALFGYATIFNKILQSYINNESKINISKIIEDDNYALASCQKTILTHFMDTNDPSVFHITPIWEAGLGHAFTLLTVFNKNTKDPILTLKLDASRDGSRFDIDFGYIKYPIVINLENPTKNLQETLIVDYLEKKLLINIRDVIKGPKTFINEETKSIVTIDNPTYVAPKWVKHSFDYNSKTKLLCLNIHNKPLIFDASHDIQPIDTYIINNKREVVIKPSCSVDNNCALYSMNIIKGLCDMLNNPEMAENIYQLAKELEDNPENKTYEYKLLKIFNTDLKYFLPCYYNPDGSKKNIDELRNFHNQQKWDIGNKWLLENLQNTEDLNLHNIHKP